MQTQPTNPIIKELRSKITDKDMLYLVRVNYGIQVCVKRPGLPGKNITVGMSRAFGYDLMPNGLRCSEWQIIEDLVETLPQICQPSGLLNIELR